MGVFLELFANYVRKVSEQSTGGKVRSNVEKQVSSAS